jgi:hypothetical protein
MSNKLCTTQRKSHPRAIEGDGQFFEGTRVILHTSQLAVSGTSLSRPPALRYTAASFGCTKDALLRMALYSLPLFTVSKFCVKSCVNVLTGEVVLFVVRTRTGRLMAAQVNGVKTSTDLRGNEPELSFLAYCPCCR